MPRTRIGRDPQFVRRATRLYKQGLSCTAIARKLGVARSTVSRFGKEKGWQWGASNLEKAHEATRAYGAERRSAQILRLAARFDEVEARMGERHVAFSFGGRDNVYAEHEFDRPDSRTLREYANTLTQLVAAMKSLHTFDLVGAEETTDVQRYLALQKGEKP